MAHMDGVVGMCNMKYLIWLAQQTFAFSFSLPFSHMQGRNEK
jgi:hypothetical protein